MEKQNEKHLFLSYPPLGFYSTDVSEILVSGSLSTPPPLSPSQKRPSLGGVTDDRRQGSQ